MQSGGMDGIELQVYGHLLDQIWSPLTNDLVGPYGADTLENRMRFPLDVVAAIRKRVGAEFIVGLRYTADEAQKDGITHDEGLEISKHIAANAGEVDYDALRLVKDI
jgi:2,4-dienoyl-CoA reductase-like NADH-dependent reductase (Old Yellow Enzyme family)